MFGNIWGMGRIKEKGTLAQNSKIKMTVLLKLTLIVGVLTNILTILLICVILGIVVKVLWGE